jgi:glycosyltransferase involved in cell wall biosynthesis
MAETGVRLLFDLAATQPLSGERHGGGEYARSVLTALARDADGRMDCVYRAELPLDQDLRHLCGMHGLELLPVASKHDIPRLITERRIGRFFSALPYRYHDLALDGVETVFTIHGLRPLEVPTDIYELRYARGVGPLARVAGKLCAPGLYRRVRRREFARLVAGDPGRRTLIVPSRHTKYALLTHFPDLNAARIRVMYSPRPPEDMAGAEPLEPLAPQSGGRPYLLMISGNRWVKNAVRAVRALDELYTAQRRITLSTVVLGVTDPRVFGRLGNPDRFEFRDYVDRPTLDGMYRNAFAFIFPTLNEGFGYPPLESMRHGTPVICSAVASTTEVCGDAALYFDPRSRAELQNRVLHLALEPGARDRLTAAGRERHGTMSAHQDAMLEELCDLLLMH